VEDFAVELTVRDVARALKVNENEVYRLMSRESLPAERVHGVYRFHRVQLLEWATLQKREVSPDLFRMGNGNGGGRACDLHEALRTGGIFHKVKGADRESVLRAVVQAMPLPASIDRAFLLDVLLSREAVGSTGIGEGIALPHPNYPVVLPLERPFVTLCFLDQPIPYSSTDRQPVQTLFASVCPTARSHLDLLARLACALNDAAFRDLIRRQGAAADILQQAARIEEALHAAAAKSEVN
jgi:PTS system nitrogen regulatory IIA component